LKTTAFHPQTTTAVAIIAAALFIAPLWIVSVPAMLDGPSRFAELYLLQNLPDDKLLARFYETDWTLIPALAGDVIVSALTYVLPLTGAINVFLSLGVTFWVIGPFLVYRALTGKLSPLPLFGSIFAYNECFSEGWWDCYFGMGAGLVLFAGWIWSARLNPLPRYALFSALTGLIFILHLFACAVLLVLIGAYELGQTLSEKLSWQTVLRKLAWLASLAVIPLCLYATSVHVASKGTLVWAPIQSWPHRFGSALEIGPYQPLWFVTGPLLVFGAFVVIGGLASVHPRMRFLLLAIGALCLLVPLSADGTWGVSFRLPALLCALFFASLEWKLSRAQERDVLAAAAAISIVVIGALILNWRQFDGQMREFRSALAHFPEGSKVFTAMSDRFTDSPRNNVYIHIGEFNITDREGFSSNLLSTRGQHIVHPVADARSIATGSSEEGVPPRLSELPPLASGNGLRPETAWRHRNVVNWRCKFDGVILLRTHDEVPVLPPGFEVLQQGSFFLLAKVVPARACAQRGDI
jgi:hypothetical protein